MVSPQLDPFALRMLKDPSFIFPVCQLFIMQHELEEPVLYDWEVKVFLLEHLRFQSLTDNDFLEISKERIVPNPRGVQLATLYTSAKFDFASKIVGKIVPIANLMPLNCSLDGIHFQKLYLDCKRINSVDLEATIEEKDLIRPYFDIVTSNGIKVKQYSMNDPSWNFF